MSPEERFAAHIARAEELAAEGRDNEAILEYRNALTVDESSAEINQRIAELMLNQGASENAARYFSEAYRLDSSRIDAPEDSGPVDREAGRDSTEPEAWLSATLDAGRELRGRSKPMAPL